VVQVGDVLEVIVTRVQNYGLFIVADDLPGLILIPELSWDRISHPSQIADVGDSLRCKVIHLPDQKPPATQFVASIRALHPENNPWRDPDVYAVGNCFSGPVVKRMAYGCFIQHPNSAWVLIHTDDIPPNDPMDEGQVITVQITECDVEGQKVRGHLIKSANES